MFTPSSESVNIVMYIVIYIKFENIIHIEII